MQLPCEDIWCLSSEINPLPALLNSKGWLWGAEVLSATVSWLKAQGICMKLDFVGLGPVAELAGASQFEAAILSYLQQFVEVLLLCCFAGQCGCVCVAFALQEVSSDVRRAPLPIVVLEPEAGFVERPSPSRAAVPASLAQQVRVFAVYYLTQHERV